MTVTLARASWTTPGGHFAALGYREQTSDWNTIASVMLPHDEYVLPSGRSGVALDAGAHIGAVTVALALDNPDLHVIAVEPVPDNVALLRDNVAVNGLAERVTIIAGAVAGRHDATVTVWYGYRGSEAAEHHAYIGNSTLAYDAAATAAHETVEVPAIALDRLPALDFVKIDTEGGEWAFLDDPAIAGIPEIVGEWHPVRGHTMGDLLAILGPTHEVTFSGPQAGPGGFRAVRR